MSIASFFNIWRKRIASFAKRDWQLEDYPIEVKHRDAAQYAAPYCACISRWPGMGAFGKSRADALSNLKQHFEKVRQYRKDHGKNPVRPGTKVKIEFASYEKASMYPKIYDHFVEHALELEGAWMSDESTLWDSHEETSCESLQHKIRDIYGIDVSDTVVIWEILHRIHAKGPRLG